MFWTIPTLCVESWLEQFNENSKREEGFDACLYYGILTKMFSPFFFLFYLVLQLLSIIQAFSGIAKFVNQDSTIDIPEYLTLLGYMLSLGLERKSFNSSNILF